MFRIFGTDVPDHPGYRFGESRDVWRDGDINYITVHRRADHEHIGAAEGETFEELVHSAKVLAQDDERAQE